MKKIKNQILYVAIFFVLSFSLVSASVSLTLDQPSGNLEVNQNEIFTILATISCSSSDCNDFSVGLKIPDLKTVDHNFSSTSENDCFGGTCLVKPLGNGPLEIASGNANWGWGKCFSGPVWVGSDMKSLSTFIGGMKNIPGIDLCLETDNGEKWDVVFSSWPVGGIGDFVYTRTMEESLLDTSKNSLPFYVSSGSNPVVMSLNTGESVSVSFSVNATGEKGDYSNLVLFASDKETDSLDITIILNETVITPENPADDEDSKKSSSHSSRNIDSTPIVFTSDTSVNIKDSGKEETISLASKASNSSTVFSNSTVLIILGLILILLMIIFLILLTRRNY